MSAVHKDMFMKAAEAIRNSKAILVTAGAGMSVDSGLPDFRGPEGFWKAYPPLKKRGLKLPEMSNPDWFERDPHFAWGFFGHRYTMYSSTEPHDGFQILRKWAAQKPKGAFVFTSNVDGHFQKAGFSEESVFECHGSINYLQLVDSSRDEQIWRFPAEYKFVIRDEDLHAEGPLPQGPPGADEARLARPNILMFGDWGYVGSRQEVQGKSYHQWLYNIRAEDRLVVIEIGAGTFVPTVRWTSESVAKSKKATLIRINPREPDIPKALKESHAFPMGGLECLNQIDSVM